jgi:hypothetical protein
LRTKDHTAIEPFFKTNEGLQGILVATEAHGGGQSQNDIRAYLPLGVCRQEFAAGLRQ